VAHARLEGIEDDGLDVALEDGIEEVGFRREVDDQKGWPFWGKTRVSGAESWGGRW